MLAEPHTGLLIGLHHNEANHGENFEESHTGMDHISFEVADRAALEAWMDRLDELNIGHTGIRRRPNGPALPPSCSAIPITTGRVCSSDT